MRNRSLFNNDYSGYTENSIDEFSLEDNFLDDIRFNHDLSIADVDDYDYFTPPKRYAKSRSGYGCVK